MSDGGTISNTVTYKDENGRLRRSLVLTSHNFVTFGFGETTATFKRDDLLFAMGAVEEKHRPRKFVCEVCEDKGGPGPLEPCEHCNRYGDLPHR